MNRKDVQQAEAARAFFLAKTFIDEAYDALDPETQNVPGYKRVNGLLKSALTQMGRIALNLVPLDACTMIKKQAQSVHLVPEQNHNAIRKDQGFFIETNDWYAIMSQVITDNCALCANTGGQVTQCKIRKMLDKYCVDPKCSIDDCPWKYLDFEQFKKVKIK